VKIDTICTGARPPRNDDCASFCLHNADFADLWVIDGATSIAERAYIDGTQGDPAWFVQTLNRYLEQHACVPKSPQQIIELAICGVGQEFRRWQSAVQMPLYARPVAAITWVRVRRDQRLKWSLDIYALGDCKAFMEVNELVRDMDPYVNPHEASLASRVRELQINGVRDESEIRILLASLLRDRRQEQNLAERPSVLCLEPRGELRARRHSYTIPMDRLRVLLMTDGFYRLVDTYHVYSDSELFQACAAKGLRGVLNELRNLEAAWPTSWSGLLKRSDDASALLCATSSDCSI